MFILQKIKKCFKNKEKYYIVKSILFSILCLLLLMAIIVYFINDNSSRKQQLLFFMLQYIAMMVLMLASLFVKRKWDIKIPVLLDASFVTVGFLAFILGDVLNFYGRFAIWDDIIHFLSGIVLALVCYFILDVVIQHEKTEIHLSPIAICISIVLFTVSIATIWEISEYMYDDFFRTNTQQYMESTTGSIVSKEDIPLKGHEALTDTIQDLMLDLAGSISVGIVVYYYEKKDKNKVERI